MNPNHGYGGGHPPPQQWQQQQPYNNQMQQQPMYNQQPQQPQQPQTQQADASAAIPYIGKKISLRTHDEMRYEGTFYTIDTVNQSIALQNVKFFGTEDRPAPKGFVPPSENVLAFATFTQPEIASLVVLPDVVDAPTPQQTQQHQQQHQQNNNKQQKSWGNKAPPKSSTSVLKPVQSSSSSNALYADDDDEESDGGEFDFDAANARFDKQAFAKEKAQEAKGGNVEPTGDIPSTSALDTPADEGLTEENYPKIEVQYNKKKSFFDTISSDRDARSNYKGNRQQDYDTFGETRNNRNNNNNNNNRRNNRGGQNRNDQPQWSGSNKRSGFYDNISRNQQGGGGGQQWRSNDSNSNSNNQSQGFNRRRRGGGNSNNANDRNRDTFG